MFFSRELGVSEEKVNVNGGSIALGHPIGMPYLVMQNFLVIKMTFLISSYLPMSWGGEAIFYILNLVTYRVQNMFSNNPPLSPPPTHCLHIWEGGGGGELEPQIKCLFLPLCVIIILSHLFASFSIPFCV
jgi:hypothetical protein